MNSTSVNTFSTFGKDKQNVDSFNSLANLSPAFVCHPQYKGTSDQSNFRACIPPSAIFIIVINRNIIISLLIKGPILGVSVNIYLLFNVFL